MKILITGGSGFIGTNLVEKFVKNGYDVLNIDFQKPRNMDFVKYWRNVDITNFADFQLEVKSFNPNYIVHLAARTDLDGFNLNDYSANILGVRNLMEIIKDLKYLKKIIITSSMLVCKVGFKPKDYFDYNPNTFYGESKVLTEKIVFDNPPKCDWIIIRPTSIWGPWFNIPYRTFFDMVLSNKYFHIGNTICTKTYGYVGNSVYQINMLLTNETIDKSNKIFYIGDYQPIKISEWANEIAQKSDVKILKLPYLIIKLAAYFGDILNFFNISFPMTSFRLKNMTTNNIVTLKNTAKICKGLPYTRSEGIDITLKWIAKK